MLLIQLILDIYLLYFINKESSGVIIINSIIMNKNSIKMTTKNIYDKYRKILETPNLTEKEIEEMRRNMKLLAMIICEHVWKKKFY